MKYQIKVILSCFFIFMGLNVMADDIGEMTLHELADKSKSWVNGVGVEFNRELKLLVKTTTRTGDSMSTNLNLEFPSQLITNKEDVSFMILMAR